MQGCPNCHMLGKGLIYHTVTFHDDPNRGWVRNGCIIGYREPHYTIRLLTGKKVVTLGHDFDVDRVQALVNYPDAYGRDKTVLCKAYSPAPE